MLTHTVLHCSLCVMLYQSASYNLFNYVNEVNAEVEALEDSIEKVRSEIEAHKEQASTHVTCRALAVLSLS